MMNMIENSTDVRLYDCIWLIKPGNNYMMMKTHISLRVEEFHGMASRSDLSIRQGTTSDATEIENIVWPNNGMSKENHIVPVLSGYYIRLRGVFGISSKLAIVYSVFNYLSKKTLIFYFSSQHNVYYCRLLYRIRVFVCQQSLHFHSSTL